MPTPCGRTQSRPTPSFRTSLFGILAILLLAGCAGRPTLLPPQEESFGGETVPVYFVTTRAPSGTPEVYSGARALSASYGRVDVGIPTDRTLGTLPTTDGRPNPSRHFHQNGIYRYQSFAQMRDAALTSSGGMGVSLLVHGYNNTFAESLFRLAQLHHDADQTGAAIAFQWASLGDPRAYVHDRDSALHARQTLAATIERLSYPSSGILVQMGA